MMKRNILSFRWALAAALCLLLSGTLSCSRKDVFVPFDPDGHSVYHEGMQGCTFRIGSFGATKATGVTYADESAVSRWGLYVFDSDGAYVASGSSVSGQGIHKYLNPGTYTVCAVANYPVSGAAALDPSVKGDIVSLSALSAYAPRLEDMAVGSLVMYGSDTMVISAGGTFEKTIDVRRVVSKVGIRKVTLDWSNPAYASETFTLRHIYLTNTCGLQALGGDISHSGVSSQKGDWFNAMGFHTEGSRTATSAVDALLADRALDAVIANGSSRSVEHFFYPFPNPMLASENAGVAAWAPRQTCMVLEATLGSETYYYKIVLPEPIVRNKTYIADEVIIRNLGSTDPEVAVSNSCEVSFAFSTSWDGIDITENS